MASGQKKLAKSERGEGLLIDSSPPRSSSSELLNSAIRAQGVAIDPIDRDREEGDLREANGGGAGDSNDAGLGLASGIGAAGLAMASGQKKPAKSDKGKGLQIDSSPPKSSSPKLLSSAIRALRGVAVDPIDRDCSAIGEEGDLREASGGGAGDSDDAGLGLVSGVGAAGRSVRSAKTIARCIPFCYRRGGRVEQLLKLAPGLVRPSSPEGQNWGDVLPTRSSVGSVTLLLKRCRAHGVTFIIPSSDQRPWTPPVGYHCVYESFFGRESRLWFPIPRLITAYCTRRDVVMTQLMVGAVRIAVALMVMAAEVDVSMSVRAFEELTQVQPKPNGILTVQMRSGLHILSGHPPGPKDWQRFYFYVKADKSAFEEPPCDECRVLWSDRIVGSPNTIGPRDTFWRDIPKITALSQQKWAELDLDRIKRQRERIARVDWMSNEPFVEGRGKRLALPLMGKIPKAYPSYSEILRAQLGDGSFASISTPKGAKAKASPSEAATTGLEDIEAQRSPGGMTDATTTDFSAKESIEPTSDVDPSRKKKKKKKKSSRKSAVDPGNVDGLAEEDREASDHLIDGVDGPGSSAEKDRAGSFVAKRKEPTDGGSRDLGEKKLKRSHDSRLSSSEGIVLPASRLLPWGGSDPPSDRLALAVSERWTFRHDEDTPFVSDPGACAELMRQIRGDTHLMPEIPKLAFPDRFVESAHADMEAVIRKNRLILDYELALRGMASDFARAEATIEAKDAEIEQLKRAAVEKSKEIVNERTRYFRERKQAKQTADGLEEELETVRSKAARLEAEVETAKKTMGFMRQAHRRDLVSQTSCISAAATERLDKFRDYMIDRDRREEKLVLHSAAFGTLESMDVLKDLGIPIPQVLIDTLAANEAKYRKEMEEIAVEVISEQDLVLPRFPGLEAAQKLNQPDSSLGDADPIAAAALRSSGPASGNPATQVTLTESPELMVTDPDVGGASSATSLDRVDED